ILRLPGGSPIARVPLPISCDVLPANPAHAPYGSHDARVSVKRNKNAESAQKTAARGLGKCERGLRWKTRIFAPRWIDTGLPLTQITSTRSTRFIERMQSLSIRSRESASAVGRNIQASRFAQPNKKRFTVRRILGAADLWVTEFVLTYDGQPSYAVSIMEFKDGKVARETQYFGDPFAPGPSRAQWVEPMR